MMEPMEAELMHKANGMVKTAFDFLSRKCAWESRPFGHTTYQIRNFIFNNREYPSGAARYRQALRELWARREAYWSVKDRHDELAIELDALSLSRDMAGWRKFVHFIRYLKLKHEITMRMTALKMSQMERGMTNCLLDLEHRIIPETMDVMAIVSENSPSMDDAPAFGMDAEHEIWKHRAKMEPRLRELMPKDASNVVG